MPLPPQHRPQPRDPALDGLRGLAILLVFLFHYGGGLRAHNPLVRAFGFLTQAGWIGVDVFFALSGFLITGLLLDGLSAPHHLRNFYARRALRILPLYLAALLACGAAALLSGGTLAQLRPILLYAAFVQNLPPLLNTALHTPPPLPLHHLWSIAVEEQFYLLWPLLLLLARTARRTLRLCVWTFALSCLFRALIFNPHLLSAATADSFAVFLPTRAGALALGGALAAHRRLIPGRSSAVQFQTAPLAAVTASALGVFLLTGTLTGTLLLNNRVAFAFALPAVDLLSAALVALSLQPTPLRHWLRVPALGFLGRISYGFYVLHILLEPLFDRLATLLTATHSGFPYQTARLLMAFPITVAASWLSFTFLERPFLRLKRRFPRQAPLAPLPLAAASKAERP